VIQSGTIGACGSEEAPISSPNNSMPLAIFPSNKQQLMGSTGNMVLQRTQIMQLSHMSFSLVSHMRQQPCELAKKASKQKN
jgi:hypothetical protein